MAKGERGERELEPLLQLDRYGALKAHYKVGGVGRQCLASRDKLEAHTNHQSDPIHFAISLFALGII